MMSYINTLDREKLYVHDETLRDGRQCIVNPNESIDIGNKLKEVKKYIGLLQELGVRFVDVGVPMAGGFDLEMAKVIAELAEGNDQLCVTGFARAVSSDIDATLSALDKAKHKGISLLTSPSKLHAVKFKSRPEYVGMDINEVRNLIGKGFLDVVKDVGSGVRSGDLSRLHVYIEDSTRMGEGDELKRLAEMVAAFIQAGATDISLPDTMGVFDPDQYVDLIHGLHEILGEELVKQVFWGAHTHNDLAFGVANTMAAAKSGLVQILEGTFGGNGPGEGIGNGDLNPIIHQLTRNEVYEERSTLKDVSVLREVNRSAAGILGRKVPETSPVVGVLAPRLTAAGIHQDALYKIWLEIRELEASLDKDPENLSLEQEIDEKKKELRIYTHDYSEFGIDDAKLFSINQLSGRKGLMGSFGERDIEYNPDSIADALSEAGRIAVLQNHRLTDGQLQSLAYKHLQEPKERPVVCDFSQLEMRKKGGVTEISFEIQHNGEIIPLSSEVTDGSMVSAFTKALDKHFSDLDITITSQFSSKAEFHGEDSEKPSEVPVMVDAKVQVGEEVYTGIEFNTDQDIAGCEAVLQGVNRWLSEH